MAQQTFSLATNLTITNSAITGNSTTAIWTSANIANNNNLPSMRLIVEYLYITPNSSITGIAPTFGITAVVESQIENNWFPVAYQFNSIHTLGNGDKRIIMLAPNISVFDAGIDDEIYVADSTIAKISREQGKVASNSRVRLIVRENGYGSAGAFQSVKATIYGELYD